MPELKLAPKTPNGAESAAQMYRSPAFMNLKSYFHRKLIDKLNLEAIDQLDRRVVEEEIRTTVLGYLAEEQTPLSLAEREKLIEEILDEIFGLGPARAAAAGPDDHRHPGQRPEQGVRRAARPAGADRRCVFRDDDHLHADHRPHRLERRPARRRVVARWWTPACRTARA